MAVKWQDIEGWFDEDDFNAFAGLKPTLPKSPNIVECGTYKGKSTNALAEIWPKAYIRTCDPNEPRPENLPHNAEFYPFEGSKLEAKNIDLLFIDDSHLYDDIKATFEHMKPHLKPGAYVVFHDYCFETDAVDGVRRFVDELGGCEIYKGKYGGAIWRNL